MSLSIAAFDCNMTIQELSDNSFGHLGKFVSQEYRGSIRKIEARRCGFSQPEASLNDDGPRRSIASVGNYGEIFERSLASASPLENNRGVNSLWTRGEILCVPPIRQRCAAEPSNGLKIETGLPLGWCLPGPLTMQTKPHRPPVPSIRQVRPKHHRSLHQAFWRASTCRSLYLLSLARLQ